MRKRKWESVFDDNADFMATMVTVAHNKYRGCTTKEGLNADFYGNSSGKFLFANLLDKDDIVVLAGEAFKKAYREWDGVRPFKALYRTVFMNLVEDMAKAERRHRMRETVLSIWDNEEGETTLEVPDERAYLVPVAAVDFVDFVETLPDAHRMLVTAILDAPKVLGIKAGNPSPITILSALRKYAKKMGIPIRTYWKLTTEISYMLEERTYG